MGRSATTRKQLITADTVVAEHAAGRLTIAAPRRTTIVTPGAWSMAHQLGVSFTQADAAQPAQPPGAPPGTSERQVDASGVVVVRGSTVKLGRFAAAGAGRDVRLADVVTGGDGSPMTAGFMQWRRADSFDWKLDYAEVDYVLEGVLHLGIAGRVVEGRPGDVLYVPRGSQVTFGTPHRVKVFYVTWPADWAAASAPKR